MLRRLYEYFLKNKFFNKIILIYILITVMTITGLMYLISERYSVITTRQNVQFNMQVLETVDQFLYTRIKAFKQVIQSLYMDESDGRNILEILQNKVKVDSDDYMYKHISIVKFLNEKAISADQSMEGVFLYKADDKSCFFTSRNYSNAAMNQLSSEILRLISKAPVKREIGQPPYFIAEIETEIQNIPSQLYVIYYYVSDNIDSNQVIGFMAGIYDVESIRHSFQKFEKYLKGQIRILSPDGEVVFDSAAGADRKEAIEIVNSSTGTQYIDNNIFNLYKNPQYQFITYGKMSHDELLQDINPLRYQISVIALLSIAFLILLTYLSTKLLTRRIRIIISAMKQIQNGNYNIRIHSSSQSDEIGQIIENFNIMGNKIEEYIEKEYVFEIDKKTSELRRKEAELRQKNAELLALQSQIDPHFLYNSLESIRMKALTTGENDVSKMIRILASIFRNNIKSDMIANIKDEIEYCKAYLEMYKIRYGDRLQVEFRINREIDNYGILRHLIQPVIENSIVHGISVSRSNNLITIIGEKSEGDIFITVKDNGKGMDNEMKQRIIDELDKLDQADKLHPGNGSSIGLQNVSHRIRLIYGDNYRLKVNSTEDEGTEVTLIIKAMTREELEKHVQGAAGG